MIMSSDECKDLTDDKSTLVQVMAWSRQATSHYLDQCWPRSPTPYGVTRPQWVKLNQTLYKNISVLSYRHLHYRKSGIAQEWWSWEAYREIFLLANRVIFGFVHITSPPKVEHWLYLTHWPWEIWLKFYIFKLVFVINAEVSLLKLPSDECHWILWMINQHWFRYGLVPSGNKPLPEPMLTQIYDTIWHC